MYRSNPAESGTPTPSELRRRPASREAVGLAKRYVTYGALPHFKGSIAAIAGHRQPRSAGIGHAGHFEALSRTVAGARANFNLIADRHHRARVPVQASNFIEMLGRTPAMTTSQPASNSFAARTARSSWWSNGSAGSRSTRCSLSRHRPRRDPLWQSHVTSACSDRASQESVRSGCGSTAKRNLRSQRSISNSWSAIDRPTRPRTIK